MCERCSSAEVNQEEKQLLIKKWFSIFVLISVVLLPFFTTHEELLENKVYNNNGQQYFYRAGIRFVRSETGWIAKPGGKRSGRIFVYDPDFKMPGDPTFKFNDTHKGK